MALSTRSIVVQSTRLSVVALMDRRSPALDDVEWLFQCDIEPLLYGPGRSTGAFYRLLARCNEPFRPTLSLRRNSVDQLLVTDAEWRQLVEMIHHSVRMLTLVPLDAVAAAVRMYGESPVTIELLEQLDLAIEGVDADGVDAVGWGGEEGGESVESESDHSHSVASTEPNGSEGGEEEESEMGKEDDSDDDEEEEEQGEGSGENEKSEESDGGWEEDGEQGDEHGTDEEDEGEGAKSSEGEGESDTAEPDRQSDEASDDGHGLSTLHGRPKRGTERLCQARRSTSCPRCTGNA